MKILALDLSLTAPGYCVGDDCGTIKVPSKLRGMERIQWIKAEAIGRPRIAGVGLVIIEGYSYGSKGAAVVNIGELGGVIRHSLWSQSIPYVEIPPSCLKKYATGKGNASKDDVLQAGVMRSGHTFADNNACDAWWLHQMALAEYQPDNPTRVSVPQTHWIALASVAWVALGKKDAA